jgi:Tfp pilus assembly protein PilF
MIALLENYSEANIRAAIDAFEHALRIEPRDTLVHAARAEAFTKGASAASAASAPPSVNVTLFFTRANPNPPSTYG